MKPVIEEDKCIGCGACVTVCPTSPKVMEMQDVDGEKKSSLSSQKCAILGQHVFVHVRQARSS